MAHHRRFHRVRHHAGRAVAGAKGTVLGVASGAAAAIVAGYSQAMIPFLQTAGWWVMPAALALVGHFLKRRNPVVGGAVIGIAGYQAYGNFVAAKATPGAKGFSDAGAMPWSDAGGMVVSTPTSYIDSPGTVASLGTTAGAGMLYTKEAMGVPLDAGELYD